MNITIEKPRGGVAACLLVDDPAPCINPFYYFRLQVDREGHERHEATIPVDFLAQFASVCETRGMRGKFSVLPFPAGLGSILEGWEGCDQEELHAWLELARTRVAARFDITPEIMTHTLALDLETRTLLPVAEHDWMAELTSDQLETYLGASLQILKQAGFAPNGITQPCYFNGSRGDYAAAVLKSVRANGGPPVTYYFIDGYFDAPPVPEHEVVLLDRERGEAVVSIMAACNDYFWPTQRVTSRSADQVVDDLITADGRNGRLVELAEAGTWVTLVCHWQTLYSDGSRAGLKALDEAAARLERAYGPRLVWLTTGEIACYRAAGEACSFTTARTPIGWEIHIDSAFDCPDFTLSIADIEFAAQSVTQVSGAHALVVSEGALLAPDSWRQAGERLTVCFDLRRGRQTLHITI